MRGRGLILAAAATACFASAAALVRLAAPLSPAQVAFGRMFLGAVLVGGWARLQGQPLLLRPGPLTLYGLIAALHFLLYIASLGLTTIAHALVLVNLSPVFVALLSRWVLGETLPPSRYPGIGLALLGVAVMTGFEPALTHRMLLGDLLALLSGLCYAVYSLAGRRERDRYPLLTYASGVYFAAALFLAPLALLAPLSTPALARAAVPVLLLALIPTALGHTLYNAALRLAPAPLVNLVATQEVTGGVLIGLLLLGEWPAEAAVLGGLLSLSGVILVLRH